MSILVTGCAGFIGFHVSKKLIEKGYKTIGLDNLNNYYDVKLKRDRIKILRNISSKKKNFYFYKKDITKKNLVTFLCRKHNIKKIIHLAAQAGVRYSLVNPYKYIDDNIVGFLNILEASRKNKILHLIYASTSSVYGSNTNYPFKEKNHADHPIQLYAATKRSNELIAHSYSHLFNIPSTGLRFFTVYGPWGRPDMALFLFAKNISQNKYINVFNHGKHIRDFTYIDDAVDAVIKILQKGYKKEKNWNSKKPDPSFSNAPFNILNIGQGNQIKLLRYIKCIEKELGKKAKKRFTTLQRGDIKTTHADIKKIKNLYNYESKTSIETGVRNYIKWFKRYYKF